MAQRGENSSDITESEPKAVTNDGLQDEPSRSEKVKKFLLKWHLPMMLVTGLLIGYLFPPPGEFLGEADLGGICFSNLDICVYGSVSSLCITFIFVMSGMKLKTAEIKRALRTWKPALFGFVSILFITPCVSLVIVRVNYSIPEFAAGLALFFAQATTLSSGPIITGQAKGNIALALLLTVSTNIIGVFTMPLFVSSALDYYTQENFVSNDTTSDGDLSISVDPVPIIIQLVFVILIPLAFGKLLRNLQSVQSFTKAYGKPMKLLSSFLLTVIVWMKVSSSAEDLNSLSFLSIFVCFVSGIIVHIIYLLFNYSVCSYAMHMRQAEKRAVVIVASQKTLPVAITVLDILPSNVLGSPGLVAVPIIIAHFVQIVIDAFIAASWAARPLENDEEGSKIVEENSSSNGEVSRDEETPNAVSES
mmetsp:Transcript_13658/g.16553  ORF Transcript_13658/g.16553 Transcript_13658/m.16553 type:complete len:419 (+) Transcript_13658:150-1406(+)